MRRANKLRARRRRYASDSSANKPRADRPHRNPEQSLPAPLQRPRYPPADVPTLLRMYQAQQLEFQTQNEDLCRTRRQLEESRHWFADLFDSAPDAYIVTGFNGHIQQANLAACRLLTLRKEFLDSLPLAHFIARDDRPKFLNLLSRFKNGLAADRESVEISLSPHYQEPLPCALTVNVVRDRESVPIGLRWLVRDISERRRTAQTLRQSEERFRALVEATSEVIYRMNPDWTIMLELRGRRLLPDVPSPDPDWFEKYIHAEDQPLVKEAIRKAIQTKSTYEQEHRVHCSNSSVVWVSSRAIPRLDPQGHIIEWFGATTDITARKFAEESLREALADLEHMSYAIIHDLRAPLRAITGFCELGLVANLQERQLDRQTLLRRTMAAAGRMDALITDALCFSRTAREELTIEPVNAAAVLQDVLDNFNDAPPPKPKIQVLTAIPWILANQAGLAQCFSNLIGNAIKFAKPASTPTIRVWSKTQTPPTNSPQPSLIRIYFEDQGIGIPKEFLPRAFDMFSRGHHGYEGTGVGLALVRKTMQRMGGKVGVESEEGRGSCFWLEFPKSNALSSTRPGRK